MHDRRPSPSHRPSLSRIAGEGLPAATRGFGPGMPQDALLAAVIAAGAGLIACLGTRALIPLLRRRAVLDRPNERSSHAMPTPRGGGIAVVGAILLGWLALIGLDLVPHG